MRDLKLDSLGSTLYGGAKSTTTEKTDTSQFSPSHGCMPQLWKYMNSGAKAIINYCALDDDKCTKKLTQSTVFACEPYPDLLILNINWYSDKVGPMDSFAFSMSIAQVIKISDMFELADK